MMKAVFEVDGSYVRVVDVNESLNVWEVAREIAQEYSVDLPLVSVRFNDKAENPKSIEGLLDAIDSVMRGKKVRARFDEETQSWERVEFDEETQSWKRAEG